MNENRNKSPSDKRHAATDGPGPRVPGTGEAADRLDRLLRGVHYNLIRLSRHELRELKMTPPRYHVLSHVLRNDPIDMGTLHRAMHVTRSTLTSLVDSLVDDGLLARERHPDDRRRVVLRGTEHGVSALETLRRVRCEHLAAALGTVDAKRIKTTEKTLESIVSLLEQKNEGELDGCNAPPV